MFKPLATNDLEKNLNKKDYEFIKDYHYKNNPKLNALIKAVLLGELVPTIALLGNNDKCLKLQKELEGHGSLFK